MATARIQLTSRDIELLTAIERCPLTVRQLRTISITFSKRFGSDRRLQDRLIRLARAGLVHRFRYAALDGSGQFYYTLSPESYRLLHGEDAGLPSPGLFREISISRQHHTRSLADFITHTIIATHEVGVTIREFSRENALKLSLGEEHLYPDCSFTLMLPDRPPFVFYAELDNSTEPLTSPSQRDSWLRKLRFYESLQNRSSTRFRVLGLITRSKKRLQNIAALAASVAKDWRRSLFYGSFLPEYVAHSSPLTAPLFLDHRGLHVSLLPTATPTLLERTNDPAHDRSLAGHPLTMIGR